MSVVELPPKVADAAERLRGLDPAQSCIVQAPAGSGKTELLTLRYLALLPTVEQPEQVLAITFTRKATAEMRQRVLDALEAAERSPEPNASGHDAEVRRLAQAALAHAETRGWNLLAQPQRLNVQTIDALALSIAYQTPFLSRLGGEITPTEDAQPLYALAAERTLALLGSAADQGLAAALADMLRHRDASLADCESLIATMLARRDQWLLLLPGISLANPPWEQLRAQLEAPFAREHARLIAELQRRFHAEADLARLLEMAELACDNGMEELAALRGCRCSEPLDAIRHWVAMSHFLLIKNGNWRKQGHSCFNATEKAWLKARIAGLADRDGLHTLLVEARNLPPAAYSEEEWATVRHIFIVLRHAAAQLRVVFAERGLIDFAEAGISAHGALADAHVLMRLDAQVQHLLVDEFQDTSRPHFSLLRTLLSDWQPGDGRTCFCVGDPMQSIYLFRDAEPRLFEQVRRGGLELDGGTLPMPAIRLSTNFRSQPEIVAPLNDIFARVFGSATAAGDEESVPYAASVASRGIAVGDAIHLHLQIAAKNADRDSVAAAAVEDFMQVVRAHLPAIEKATREGGVYRVAVLVRSRAHLVGIMERLRQEAIPFRGVKIDLLRDRPEILDLLSLLRALLHPADRIAWLGVLRAPWCGLTLPALHALFGDVEEAKRYSVQSLIRVHADRLDEESRRRALHVLAVLDHAQDAYAQGALAGSPASLAQWLERAWHALGAPAYLDALGTANAASFFATLAQMPNDCFGTLDESLNQRLEGLYAEADPHVSETAGLQLMTIHSAKGLEFEAVLLPDLHKPARTDDAPLFHQLVRKSPGASEDELLLAPIGRKHSDKPPLYQWIGRKSRHRLREEDKRLLYVACSRAIRELHLFASVERKPDGSLCRPEHGTLLRAGWDGLEPRIAAAARPPATAKVIQMPSPAADSPVRGAIARMAAQAEPAQTLRRLPSDWYPRQETLTPRAPASEAASTLRWKGDSRLARVQGLVLHALLEHAAAAGVESRPDWRRLADTLLRQHALASSDVAAIHDKVLRGIETVWGDPAGRWLLRGARDKASARTELAWTEQAWSSIRDERLVRQRPDRVFLGGPSPESDGEEFLWIVDYKTRALPEDANREDFLAASREQYREQLEAYSDLFRRMPEFGSTARQHRLALYHPLLPCLDWWPR